MYNRPERKRYKVTRRDTEAFGEIVVGYADTKDEAFELAKTIPSRGKFGYNEKRIYDGEKLIHSSISCWW